MSARGLGVLGEEACRVGSRVLHAKCDVNGPVYEANAKRAKGAKSLRLQQGGDSMVWRQEEHSLPDVERVQFGQHPPASSGISGT
ncbi:uncharacterized protein DMAD_01089 [Drosophila madeirensis]|uniref:Uncharacterized protein n=1 Tax=Drosophila madeirensis TaxID=30013 RepID=A0AAU9G0V7_DROMD